MGDAGDELADGGELFSAAEMIGDFALLGEIPDADNQPHDVVAAIADVTEGESCRELGAVFSPVRVLAGPQRVFLGDWRNGQRAGELRRRDDEVVDRKPRD